jgi:hypothetical protein
MTDTQACIRSRSMTKRNADALLKIGKKKSSGWRPAEKRPWRPEPERQALHRVERVAAALDEYKERRLWHTCPAPRCRRLRACIMDPRDCIEQRRLAHQAQARQAEALPAWSAAAQPAAAAPVLSAKEGAALIAASLAEARARGEISDEI